MVPVEKIKMANKEKLIELFSGIHKKYDLLNHVLASILINDGEHHWLNRQCLYT